MNNLSETINGPRPVLVDFFATWCGPCKMQSAILEQLKEKIGDDIAIVKIDVDKNRELVKNYQVQSMPTLILFRNGEIVWRKSGVQPLDLLLGILRQPTPAYP